MADKYTELAREFINEYDPGGEYYLDTLATLLRRVARDQIEEDAYIAVQIADNHGVHREYQGRNRYIDTKDTRSDAYTVEYALRSRAKELED